MAVPCKIDIISNPPPQHDKNSCCGIIFGAPCNKKLEEQLWLPLELTFPDIYGEFDDEQKELINLGASPLILVENASEMVSQMKNIPGFIEQIINLIIADNKSDYVFLGVETFPVVIKEKWLKKFPDTDKTMIYGENEELTEKYEQLLNAIRPSKLPKNAVLQIGADLGDAGHYGILIKHGANTLVFDSMQYAGHSAYTALFAQIAEDLFGGGITVLPEPANRDACPQPTGGFINKDAFQDEKAYQYALQDTDSQNHFCYVWAIWYFHIFVKYGTLGVINIFSSMQQQCQNPLVVIKRYIWAIINSFYPDAKILNKLINEVVSASRGKKVSLKASDFITRFFMMHFRYIWDDLKTGKFQLFSVIDCNLTKVRNMNNIDKCLSYALEPVPYVLDKFTI